MAVKKEKASKPKTDNVDNVEVMVETPVEEKEVETPVVEIEEQPINDADIEVENTKVDKSNKPEGNVRIKMRVDHKCCIAMERYDLKKDKTYNVPENVKKILNDAGLLAPL